MAIRSLTHHNMKFDDAPQMPPLTLPASLPARFAFVTLVTTDTYVSGAIVVATSLRHVHASTNPKLSKLDHSILGKEGLSCAKWSLNPLLRSSCPTPSAHNVELVCFVTPDSVSTNAINLLCCVFDRVVSVERLGMENIAFRSSKTEQLSLKHSFLLLDRLKRPDLGISRGASLTKLHAWRLTAYERVIFLDADTLVIQPITHLFAHKSPLSASPDVGWPDAFNTGVMSLPPSNVTFEAMQKFVSSKNARHNVSSWDGADQGLLNEFYGGELHAEDSAEDEDFRYPFIGGGWRRIRFNYNVTPHSNYTYRPAFDRYGSQIRIVHYIGVLKPWNQLPENLHFTFSSRNAYNWGCYNDVITAWYQTLFDFDAEIANLVLSKARAQVMHSYHGSDSTTATVFSSQVLAEYLAKTCATSPELFLLCPFKNNLYQTSAKYQNHAGNEFYSQSTSTSRCDSTYFKLPLDSHESFGQQTKYTLDDSSDFGTLSPKSSVPSQPVSASYEETSSGQSLCEDTATLQNLFVSCTRPEIGNQTLLVEKNNAISCFGESSSTAKANTGTHHEDFLKNTNYGNTISPTQVSSCTDDIEEPAFQTTPNNSLDTGDVLSKGLPPKIYYANEWDSVQPIQRYALRLKQQTKDEVDDE